MISNRKIIWGVLMVVLGVVLLYSMFSGMNRTDSANSTHPSQREQEQETQPQASPIDESLPEQEQAKKIVSGLSDKELIGQLVMFTPAGEAGEFSRQMIQDYGVGSALLNRQTATAEETASLIDRLQEWALSSGTGIPLLISGDLEYGAAQRVPGEATILPRQMAIGATGKAEYAEEAARITAREAKALGFHWSFSPVADVNSNPLNPVIGVRSFGENAELVSRMAAAQVKAYKSEGVIASAKHFPGHGDTGFDSHSTLSKVSYSEEVLRDIHLAPFRAAIAEGIESIMTAHIIIEAIDPELPATLSPKVLTGLLREELGFEGIIVTDAMVMDAISANWGAGQAAVMAINAGADIVMANGSQYDQLDTLDQLNLALQEGRLDRDRVEESALRVVAQKLRSGLLPQRELARLDQDVIGAEEHAALAAKIALDSITLIKNEDQLLPFDAESDEKTLVVSMIYGEELAAAARSYSKGEVKVYQASPGIGEKPDADQAAITEAKKAALWADRIIIFTYSDKQLPEGQKQLVEAMMGTGKPVAAVSLGNPSDLTGYPGIKAYLAAYALDNWYWQTAIPVSWEAAIRVIFGEEPKGKLPITISPAYPSGFGLSYP